MNRKEREDHKESFALFAVFYQQAKNTRSNQP
jgi:hypothetical protein